MSLGVLIVVGFDAGVCEELDEHGRRCVMVIDPPFRPPDLSGGVADLAFKIVLAVIAFLNDAGVSVAEEEGSDARLGDIQCG
ncbi:hypothetical protein GCM10009805_04470 [Leucobacter chromiireducens subsp. solipictus]